MFNLVQSWKKPSNLLFCGKIHWFVFAIFTAPWYINNLKKSFPILFSGLIVIAVWAFDLLPSFVGVTACNPTAPCACFVIYRWTAIINPWLHPDVYEESFQKGLNSVLFPPALTHKFTKLQKCCLKKISTTFAAKRSTVRPSCPLLNADELLCTVYCICLTFKIIHMLRQRSHD